MYNSSVNELVIQYQKREFATQQWKKAREYVHRTLDKKGFTVEKRLRHPNTDYDIEVETASEKRHIKVRAFRPILDKGILTWRLTVEYRGGRAYDMLVGVLMQDEYKQPQCYVFTDAELDKLDNYSDKKFKHIKKAIRLFTDKKEYRHAVKSKVRLREFEHYVNKHKDEFLNKWHKITQ